MNQEQRLVEIKSLLKKKQQLSTREIAQHFGISFDTARRDIIRLTRTGQVLRIHGGIMTMDKGNVPDFLAREQIQSPLKNKMAQMAARFVHANQFDFIGPSTTLRNLCTLIAGQNLEIVTNSIDNALALMNSPLPEVTMLGGKIKKKDRLVYSMDTIKELENLHFNTAFIGTSKIRADGIYTATLEDAQIISTVVDRANQVVLIAEKYKFTNTNSSPFKSAPLDKVDVLITDVPLSQDFQQKFSPTTQIIPIAKKVSS